MAENNQQLATTDQATSIINVIASAAENPEVDVLKLEKLLDMQERVMNKNAEMAFNSAMAELQPQLPTIHKSKKGHNSSYAPYEEIDKKIRPLYTKHGFALSFNSKKQDAMVTYFGTVSHKDGHSKTSEIELPADNSGSKNAIQAVGSTVSYAKRYLVGMLFNIVTTDEDDDAQGANGYITPEQKQELINLQQQVGADTVKFLKHFNVNSLDVLPAKQFNQAIVMLKAKGKK